MIVLFAFLHHIAFLALAVALTVELALLRVDLTNAIARRILVADLVLGASALSLLGIGLARVFFFEKGAVYYFGSHAFLAKLGLFILAGAFSVIPTVEFLSWRKVVRAGGVPEVEPRKIRLIRLVIHGELTAIALIMLFAAVMARGGWY